MILSAESSKLHELRLLVEQDSSSTLLIAISDKKKRPQSGGRYSTSGSKFSRVLNKQRSQQNEIGRTLDLKSLHLDESAIFKEEVSFMNRLQP